MQPVMGVWLNRILLFQMNWPHVANTYKHKQLGWLNSRWICGEANSCMQMLSVFKMLSDIPSVDYYNVIPTNLGEEFDQAQRMWLFIQII